LFMLHNEILSYNRHTDPAKPYDALRVCVPTVKLEEVFKICQEGVAGGHRGVAGTLDKFQRTFFAMSAREKIRRLVDRCNTCLAKERSIQAKRGPHVPSKVGNVGEKLFIDLVSMSETVRKNRYMLTVQDGFTRFASAHPICNKEAGTVARVLIHKHFSVFGLPNQIHSDNGAEFVNKLWVELFGREAIVPIHWVYPIPKPDAEKDSTAWTETIQERFQTAYVGMRDKQQQMI